MQFVFVSVILWTENCRDVTENNSNLAYSSVKNAAGVACEPKKRKQSQISVKMKELASLKQRRS